MGLETSDVVGPAYAAGCGLTWLYLQVTPDAVSRSRPSPRKVSETSIDLTEFLDPLRRGRRVLGRARRARSRPECAVAGLRPGLSASPKTQRPGRRQPGLGLVLVAAGLAVGRRRDAVPDLPGVEMGGRPSLVEGRVEAEGGVATLCTSPVKWSRWRRARSPSPSGLGKGAAAVAARAGSTVASALRSWPGSGPVRLCDSRRSSCRAPR